MKISVIIPCFNEVNTIKKILLAVYSAPYPNKEIIIIDDYSQDGTRQILIQEFSESKYISKIFFHESNLGKGAAIRTGLDGASGDIIIIQDADLEYDPNEYSLLVEPILSNKADVVYGSRFIGGNARRVIYFWHRVGNGFLTLLSNAMTNLNLTDMETCYKAFKRDIILSISIEENRFGFEPEITAKISKLNCRIYALILSFKLAHNDSLGTCIN
jgi:glycosyltransferase involved in cell wall biosynthesis